MDWEWYYNIKHRKLPFLLGHMAKMLVRILFWTCRIKIEGLDRFIKKASQQGCIIMLWHNRIIITSEIFQRYAPQFTYAAFASNSRHGELIAVIAKSYKIGKAIRVSHNGKMLALKAMINHMKGGKEMLVIAPDGPRGPRYEVKPGVALAARQTSAPIIPFTWTASRYWEFKTWDKLMLPKPFSTIHVKLGEPIVLAKDAKRPLKEDALLLQEALKNLDTWV